MNIADRAEIVTHSVPGWYIKAKSLLNKYQHYFYQSKEITYLAFQALERLWLWWDTELWWALPKAREPAWSFLPSSSFLRTRSLHRAQCAFSATNACVFKNKHGLCKVCLLETFWRKILGNFLQKIRLKWNIRIIVKIIDHLTSESNSKEKLL